MSKEIKNKMIPKLRFPEFKDEPKWEEIELGEFGETISGLSGKEGADFGAGKPYVTYMQVFNNARIDITQCGRVMIAENEKQNTLQGGDVLITTSSETPQEVGFASVLLDTPNEDIYLNSFCFAYRPNGLDVFNPSFSVFLFRSPLYRKAISILAQGSTRFNISKSAFLKLKILITKNEQEQQKIASCLSSLDEYITAESQKLEALKTHKNGLMQQLFPAEGERVPKLRFLEFKDSGEWEEKKLNELCKFTRGPFGGALKKEIFVSNGYAVYEQSHAIYSNFNSFRYYINEDKFNELRRFEVYPGDIIMSCSGTMGKFAIVPKESKKGVINQALLKLTVKKDYDIEFMKATLELPITQNKLLSQSAGGAIKNVVEVAQIKEIKLFMPRLKEQLKIASCLSSLDDLITAQTEKIEVLKVNKKGLMQGLFPSV